MAQNNVNAEVEELNEEEPEFSGVCGEYGEHRGERITYEDSDTTQWECTECGAEWYEDH